MYSSNETEGIIYITLFIVISKLSLLLARKRWGKIAVRKGDTATKDSWEYISGLWKKWKLDVLLLPPALTSIQCFCFSPFIFFLSLCGPLHVSNSDIVLSAQTEEMTKILSQFLFEKGPSARPNFPLWMYWEEGCKAVQTLTVHCCSFIALQEMASGSREHRTTLQLNQRQCLLCHFASSAISLW